DSQPSLHSHNPCPAAPSQTKDPTVTILFNRLRWPLATALCLALAAAPATVAAPLKVGRAAPAFSLTDQNGAVHSLAEHHGSTVVLVFYTEDSTAGSTRELDSLHG